MNNKFVFAKVIFIILIFLINCKNSFALENKILLKINNEIITTIDVLNESNYLKVLNPDIKKIDKNRLMEISKNSIIRDKIKKITLLKIIKEINVNEEYQDKIITSMHKRIGINSFDEYKIFLKQNNLEIDYVRNKISLETLWNEMIFKKFKSRVLINRDSIKKEILNNPDEKLLLSEILFSASSDDESKKKYQKIQNDIKKEDFKNAALIHSISDSGKLGGNIGWIDKNSLSKIIYKKISSLKIGEHTKPILTPSGFLILKIEDIKKNDTKKDDLNKKIKELIRLKTNQQLNQFSNIYLNKLKMNLVVNEL